MKRRIFKLTTPKFYIELMYISDVLMSISFGLPESEEDISDVTMQGSFKWAGEQFITVSKLESAVEHYRCRNWSLEEVFLADAPPPTFDEFWEAYGYKYDKKEARDKWVKLKDNDKRLAFRFIGRYKAEKRQTGAFLAYPKTYLHKRVWEE